MIPTFLISYETMLYVGLSEAKATELWKRWSNWPPNDPIRRESDPDDGCGLVVEFDDLILASFENKPDAADDSEQEWRACLDRCGISSTLQDAIMDPHFEYLRLSQSCIYWINDTVKMRYEGLVDIHMIWRERERQLRRDAGGNQGGSSDEETYESRFEPCYASEPLQQHTPGYSRDVWGSESATAACTAAPGHTLLFKAQDQGRLAGLFDESGTLDRFGNLLSFGPSDFSGTCAHLYFSPDYRVAEHYAAYARHRAKYESVFIICISIPNAAIESLVAPDIQRIYWPDNDWKESVWCSRNREDLPGRMIEDGYPILTVGTAARGPDSMYCAMSSWNQVTESCLFRLGPSLEPCIQYAFRAGKGSRFLRENGAQSMKVFPYSSSTLQAWLAANPSSREREEKGGIPCRL